MNGENQFAVYGYGLYKNGERFKWAKFLSDANRERREIKAVRLVEAENRGALVEGETYVGDGTDVGYVPTAAYSLDDPYFRSTVGGLPTDPYLPWFRTHEECDAWCERLGYPCFPTRCTRGIAKRTAISHGAKFYD